MIPSSGSHGSIEQYFSIIPSDYPIIEPPLIPSDYPITAPPLLHQRSNRAAQQVFLSPSQVELPSTAPSDYPITAPPLLHQRSDNATLQVFLSPSEIELSSRERLKHEISRLHSALDLSTSINEFRQKEWFTHNEREALLVAKIVTLAEENESLKRHVGLLEMSRQPEIPPQDPISLPMHIRQRTNPNTSPPQHLQPDRFLKRKAPLIKEINETSRPERSKVSPSDSTHLSISQAPANPASNPTNASTQLSFLRDMESLSPLDRRFFYNPVPRDISEKPISENQPDRRIPLKRLKPNSSSDPGSDL